MFNNLIAQNMKTSNETVQRPDRPADSRKMNIIQGVIAAIYLAFLSLILVLTAEAQNPTAAMGYGTDALVSFSVSQNFPNPVINKTKITVVLPESGILEF